MNCLERWSASCGGIGQRFRAFAVAGVALAAFALGSASNANAATTADWPKEPVRIIIPSATGGGTDVIARSLQQPLSQELGVTVVAQNLPGANHALGARAVA